MSEATQQQVRVIRTQNQSALVEWVDGEGRAQRVYIPTSEVVDGSVSAEALAMGIPHGVPWAQLVEISVSPELVEQHLHRAGIWTAEDLRNNPNAAVGALQAAYGVDLAVLRRAANSFKE